MPFLSYDNLPDEEKYLLLSSLKRVIINTLLRHSLF